MHRNEPLVKMLLSVSGRAVTVWTVAWLLFKMGFDQCHLHPVLSNYSTYSMQFDFYIILFVLLALRLAQDSGGYLA